MKRDQSDFIIIPEIAGKDTDFGYEYGDDKYNDRDMDVLRIRMEIRTEKNMKDNIGIIMMTVIRMW